MLFMENKAWSNTDRNWFKTNYTGGCNKSLYTNNDILLIYLSEPPVQSIERLKSGELLYNGGKIQTEFNNVTFYYKPKILDSEHQSSDEEKLEQMKAKHKPKRRQDDEEPEKIPLLKQ